MFEVKPRVGIVVWVYNMHQVRQLRRFGLIYYSSKKMKYVYLYVDRLNADAIKKSIEKLHFVNKVELSHRPELVTEFGDTLDKKAKTDARDPFLQDDKITETTSKPSKETNQGSHEDAHHFG